MTIKARRALLPISMTLALMACAALAPMGCAAGRRVPTKQTPTMGSADKGPGELIRSESPRASAANVDRGDLATRVAGNNAFAFDLYQVFRAERENVFYSPYSIELALAMAYGGARGETERQMADALHYDLPQERLHPAFNALASSLEAGSTEPEGENEPFVLEIPTAVWGQRGYPFRGEYLDLLARNYGAGIRVVDFEEAPEEARRAINAWAEDKTDGKIERLVPEKVTNPLTRLILTNAVYFRAAWKHPFDEEETTQGPFQLVSGERVTVTMMEQTTDLAYAEGENYQAVALPYVGDEVSMVVIAPVPGRIPAFEDSLDGESLQAIARELETQHVRLRLPAFSFASEYLLSDALEAMGMSDAFSRERADFSGIDGTRRLFVSEVVHKGYVSVDEAGTEATAATAVVEELESEPGAIVEMSVQSPFVFFIRDLGTGAILFVGRVLEPVL